MCLIILCTGFIHGTQKQQLSAEHFLHHYTPGKKVELHLVLYEKLRAVNDQSRFFARVKTINGTASTGKILLHLKSKKNPPLQLGENLRVKTILKPIKKAKNPGEFNYKNYLETKGIHVELPYLFPENIKRIPTESYSLLRIKSSALKKIETSTLSSESNALIAAMVFGNRNTLSKEKINEFGDAGILHILAISGLHIGLLLLVFQFIFFPIKRIGRHALLYHLLVSGCLWIYAFAVGASSSVIRAVTMFSVFSIGAISKRKLPSYYWLLLSYFGLLLWNPLFLKQVGFQLSYAAVAGILLLYPKLKSLWQPKNFLLQKFWMLTCVSLAAQVAVMPLGLYYFGQFSGLFLLSNWIVLPFLSLYYILFIFSVVFLCFGLILPASIITIVDFGSKSLYRYAVWASEQKKLLWTDVVFDEFQLVGFYTVLILLLNFIYRKKNHFLFSTVVVLMLTISYSIQKNMQTQRSENFWVLDQFNQSTLAYRNGKAIHFYSTADKDQLSYLLSGIKKTHPVHKVYHHALKEVYQYKNTSFLVVKNNDTHLRPWPKERNVILLLSQHPKIHLELLLTLPNITKVIADGSSPRYIKSRWEKTCKEYNIPFYDTTQSGALEITP